MVEEKRKRSAFCHYHFETKLPWSEILFSSYPSWTKSGSSSSPQHLLLAWLPQMSFCLPRVQRCLFKPIFHQAAPLENSSVALHHLQNQYPPGLSVSDSHFLPPCIWNSSSTQLLVFPSQVYAIPSSSCYSSCCSQHLKMSHGLPFKTLFYNYLFVVSDFLPGLQFALFT